MVAGTVIGAAKLQITFAIMAEDVISKPNVRAVFENDFETDVAVALKLSRRRIIVDRLLAGSLIVDFFIKEAEVVNGIKSEPSSTEALVSLSAMTGDQTGVGAALFATPTFSKYTITNFTVLSNPIVKPPPPPPAAATDDPEDNATGALSIAIITLICLVGVGTILLVLGVLWCILKRKRADPSSINTVNLKSQTMKDVRVDGASMTAADVARGDLRAIPSVLSAGPETSKETQKFYGKGCELFVAQDFTKALDAFDKAIAVLVRLSPRLHDCVTGTDSLAHDHAPVLAELGAATSSNPRLNRHLQAAKGSRQQSFEAAKKFNKVLASLEVHESLQELTIADINGAIGDAVAAKIRVADIKEATAHFDKARRATTDNEKQEHVRDAVAIVACTNCPSRVRLTDFRLKIEQKILLHKCVMQKIGLLTFLVRNEN
jgi:hypothetical protein